MQLLSLVCFFLLCYQPTNTTPNPQTQTPNELIAPAVIVLSTLGARHHQNALRTAEPHEPGQSHERPEPGRHTRGLLFGDVRRTEFSGQRMSGPRKRQGRRGPRTDDIELFDAVEDEEEEELKWLKSQVPRTMTKEIYM